MIAGYIYLHALWVARGADIVHPCYQLFFKNESLLTVTQTLVTFKTNSRLQITKYPNNISTNTNTNNNWQFTKFYG